MMKIKLMALAGFLSVSIMSGTVHAQSKGEMTIYKNPSCGCCKVWAEAIEKAGYSIKTVNLDDLSLIKRQAGVPQQLNSCHTAVLGKYVVEGHVPLQAIEKLTIEQPKIRGIGVAGMPQGSLGMGYDPSARYEVMSFTYAKTEKPVLFFQAGQ